MQSDSGATISGWNVPALDSRGVIVLLHGLHDSRLSMLERARFLRAAGYSIVMIDLQAHGESSGTHITLGYHEKHDVRAAVEFAQEHYPDQPVGIIGVSLGGASAVMAAPLAIDAMVIESVFPDIRSAVYNRVAVRLGLFSPLPAELLLCQLRPRLGISASELRPVDDVSRVDCPIYVISGTHDRHTTIVETQQIHSRVRSSGGDIWLIEQASHEDLHRFAAQEYERRILQFFSRNFGE